MGNTRHDRTSSREDLEDQNSTTENSSESLRSHVAVVFYGFSLEQNKVHHWPAGAEDFVRSLTKQGIEVSVIGPKLVGKIGSKKNLKYFDRHELISIKELARAKGEPIELRLLGRKLKAWCRLRVDACVVNSPTGVWPKFFQNMDTPGVLTLDALHSMMANYRYIPGKQIIFIGTSNTVLETAIQVILMGAQCILLDSDGVEKCWRSLKDQFLALGGRILLGHRIQKIERTTAGVSKLFVQNAQGIMVLDADTVIVTAINDDSVNSIGQWKRGLFHIHRTTPVEKLADYDNRIFWDETFLQSRADWSEVYWRILKRFELVDSKAFQRSIQNIKDQRKQLINYRKKNQDYKYHYKYQGKSLAYESVTSLKSAGSTPQNFIKEKPLASLECFEETSCRLCMEKCPHGAIVKEKLMDFPRIKADLCTGCGVCVAVCPSSSAVMIRENADAQTLRYYLAADTVEGARPGDSVQALNRKGETLGTARVVQVQPYANSYHKVVEVEAPSYLIYDLRQVRTPVKSVLDDAAIAGEKSKYKQDWITINGAKRMVSLEIPATIALWQLGFRRFEEAFFCPDGQCRRCRILVNGKLELSCQKTFQPGDQVEFQWDAGQDSNIENCKDCFCSASGDSAALGSGACRGRWCLQQNNEKNAKADWFGFEISPVVQLSKRDLSR